MLAPNRAAETGLATTAITTAGRHAAAPPRDDYAVIRAALETISADWREQPSVGEIARAVGVSPVQLTRVFQRWAGLTPKQFLQAVTLDNTRAMLKGGSSLLDVAFEAGLSGPSRLHDLYVTHEAMPPGAYRNRGEGLQVDWGEAPSPFGTAILMATGYGLAGLAFADHGEEAAARDDLMRRWPNAAYRRDDAAVAPYAQRIFEPRAWQPERPLRIVMIGTDFEIKVWQTLLSIPVGAASTYSAVAERIGRPKAARAVGAAVGKNPISFVVPCHRVVGRNGTLRGYHWGLTRKRAILGWEAGRLAA
jgi:AraC family transcriptional regulator of adaptative response/methylated-DNA-[protein]-cysteine methyltransferase